MEGGATAYFDPAEAGFKEACELKARIDALARGDARGAPGALVIDADADLLARPAETLERLCAHAGLPFEPAMLSWKVRAMSARARALVRSHATTILTVRVGASRRRPRCPRGRSSKAGTTTPRTRPASGVSRPRLRPRARPRRLRTRTSTTMMPT